MRTGSRLAGGGRILLLSLSALMPFAAAATEGGAGGTAVTRPTAGRISEWPVPTNLAARDPAVDDQGNVYYAVARGDRIARFDTKTRRFTEWTVPAGTLPHGVVIAADRKVYFGGHGNGTIGELDPDTGGIRIFRSSDPASGVYSLLRDADGNIWFTERKTGKVGKLDRAKGVMSYWPMGGEPYGIAQDKRGRIWVTRIAADRLGILDPATGETSEIETGPGSKPRRVAVAPDGMVWVTLYGAGKVIKVDPSARKIVKEYDLPGGVNSGPYSVLVDRGGQVWVSMFQTDSVAVLDTKTERFRVFALPDKQSGVRNAAIDRTGRYWYISTTSGKLGVIE